MPPRSRKRPRHKTPEESRPSPPKRAKRTSAAVTKMAEEEKALTEQLQQEDPVAFLQRVSQTSPHVLSLLNTKQAKLLAKSLKEPYEGKNINEQYLTDMAAYVSAKQKIDDSQSSLRQTLLTPSLIKEEVDVENFLKQTETLKKVIILTGGRGLGE